MSPRAIRPYAFAIAAAALLSACETPYRLPTEQESRAQVTVESKDDVVINNLNAEGCYRGRTELKGAMFIRAGEEALTEYHGRAACRISFSFLPEEGKRYRIVGQSFRNLRERFEARREIESKQGIAYEACGVNLYREEENAQLVPMKPQRRVISALPTCAKFITPEEWQKIRVPPPFK